MKKYFYSFFIFVHVHAFTFAQMKVTPGAERMDVYVPLLKGKSVALFANQTSTVSQTHLADTLLKRASFIDNISL